jgi:tRNA(Ile)-lysidine synthase
LAGKPKRKGGGGAHDVAVAISGGSDSVFLLRTVLATVPDGSPGPLLLHFNHRLRGAESDEDQRFVERIAERHGLPVAVGRDPAPASPAGSRVEERARDLRYAFLRKACEERGVRRLLVGHTADDQVETVLMRILEGAGLSGLRGIPPSGEGGIERPLLGTWRADIASGLAEAGLEWREDPSNRDTRLERNWIRHVLLPLLVERYGGSVRKRILALSLRFRELDDFVQGRAKGWIRRNVRGAPPAFSRARYARQPSPVRIAILQSLVLHRGGRSPNERLLGQLDRLALLGKPSAEIRCGKALRFRNRYGETTILEGEPQAGSRPPEGPEIGRDTAGRFDAFGDPPLALEIARVRRGKSAGWARETAGADPGRSAVFDDGLLAYPLRFTPLEPGDRIRPFGAPGSRKVKEVLIDRKVPRDLRGGLVALRDARGEILWIPGVVRSSMAPDSPAARRLLCLAAGPL